MGTTMRDAAPATTATFKQLTTVPPEKFRDKVGRTLAAVLLFAATVRFGASWPAWLQHGSYVLCGVTVAGEWFLFPLRAVLAFLKDVPPIIAAIHRALKGENGST